MRPNKKRNKDEMRREALRPDNMSQLKEMRQRQDEKRRKALK